MTRKEEIFEQADTLHEVANDYIIEALKEETITEAEALLLIIVSAGHPFMSTMYTLAQRNAMIGSALGMPVTSQEIAAYLAFMNSIDQDGCKVLLGQDPEVIKLRITEGEVSPMFDKVTDIVHGIGGKIPGFHETITEMNTLFEEVKKISEEEADSEEEKDEE